MTGQRPVRRVQLHDLGWAQLLNEQGLPLARGHLHLGATGEEAQSNSWAAHLDFVHLTNVGSLAAGRYLLQLEEDGDGGPYGVELLAAILEDDSSVELRWLERDPPPALLHLGGA